MRLRHLEAAIKNQRKKRTHPEFLIHKSIADAAAKLFIPGRSMWHTTENSNGRGGEQARREQAKLKVLGVQAGFTDGMIVYEGGRIIFCEIKAPLGRLSEAQIKMHGNLELMGFEVVVVRSLDEFLRLVRDYGVPTRESIE